MNVRCECGKLGRVRVTSGEPLAEKLEIIVTCQNCGVCQQVNVPVRVIDSRRHGPASGAAQGAADTPSLPDRDPSLQGGGCA